MSLEALKIVEEEFNDYLEHQLPRNLWLILIDMRNRIRKRIEKECIEQDRPQCGHCEKPSGGRFLLTGFDDLDEDELCAVHQQLYREGGITVELIQVPIVEHKTGSPSESDIPFQEGTRQCHSKP